MRRPDSLTVAHLRPLFEGSEVPIGMLLSMHSAVHLRAMYRLFPGDLEQALIFDELVAHAAGPMNECCGS